MTTDRDVDLSDCLRTGDWLIDMMNEPECPESRDGKHHPHGTYGTADSGTCAYCGATR